MFSFGLFGLIDTICLITIAVLLYKINKKLDK